MEEKKEVFKLIEIFDIKISPNWIVFNGKFFENTFSLDEFETHSFVIEIDPLVLETV